MHAQTELMRTPSSKKYAHAFSPLLKSTQEKGGGNKANGCKTRVLNQQIIGLLIAQLIDFNNLIYQMTLLPLSYVAIMTDTLKLTKMF